MRKFLIVLLLAFFINPLAFAGAKEIKSKNKTLPTLPKVEGFDISYGENNCAQIKPKSGYSIKVDSRGKIELFDPQNKVTGGVYFCDGACNNCSAVITGQTLSCNCDGEASTESDYCGLRSGLIAHDPIEIEGFTLSNCKNGSCSEIKATISKATMFLSGKNLTLDTGTDSSNNKGTVKYICDGSCGSCGCDSNVSGGTAHCICSAGSCNFDDITCGWKPATASSDSGESIETIKDGSVKTIKSVPSSNK